MRVLVVEDDGGSSDPESDLASYWDVVEFLLERIDEDERLAQAAPPGPWRLALGEHRVVDSLGVEAATVFGLSGQRQRAAAAHVARYDPDRVMAECAAKRALVGQCVRVLTSSDLRSSNSSRQTCRRILHTLASIYENHPQRPAGPLDSPAVSPETASSAVTWARWPRAQRPTA